MEILNTYNGSPDGVSFFLLIFFGAFSLLFLYGIYYSIKEKSFKDTIGCLFMTLILGFFTYMSYEMILYPTKIIKHEVIIQDIDKFDYDKYKIIDQRGRIFTIEEIEK